MDCEAEESKLVKEYILLPIVLDVLERDIKTIESVPIKMRAIYVRTLRRVQDMVAADLAVLRKGLREHGIKVYEQHRTNIHIQARYICQGYHHNFSMLWGLIKAEVEKRLSLYLKKYFTNDGAGL
ncbi:hypothetical protein [Aneurinibacillus terranovensis]|uniref:hypothetical protein n=1 Tax=Aneurinibacillus terranovensis TaxID=278991 RepID=UPI00040F9D87|nr:hypothetical protein [Aneurinibacillus terranovensis]